MLCRIETDPARNEGLAAFWLQAFRLMPERPRIPHRLWPYLYSPARVFPNAPVTEARTGRIRSRVHPGLALGSSLVKCGMAPVMPFLWQQKY